MRGPTPFHSIYHRGYKEMSSILADQYRPRIWAQMRERGGAARSQPMSIQLYTGAQINFGDQTPYVTYGLPHRVHRVATATFWLTFHLNGKISPAWWGWGVHAHPLSLYLPSRAKLRSTLQLHSPYFSSTLYVLRGCKYMLLSWVILYSSIERWWASELKFQSYLV